MSEFSHQGIRKVGGNVSQTLIPYWLGIVPEGVHSPLLWNSAREHGKLSQHWKNIYISKMEIVSPAYLSKLR